MVSIICCTMRPSLMENIFNNYKRQVLERKEMIVILNRDDMDMNKWIKKAKDYKNVVVREKGEKKFCRTVKGGTLVFKRSVWDKVKFNENQVSGCDVSFLRKCRNAE